MIPDSATAASRRGSAGAFSGASGKAGRGWVASICGVIAGVMSGVCAASAFGAAGSRATG
ncbi:hypothetical protein AB0M80_19935 [Amycolatopsis sp. NPDC051045]|uniref:hypothetical protein n=1 Tax=Amycolatopsis sp. NPDC051045 TaxID=3156922 RepID=UPI003420717D